MIDWRYGSRKLPSFVTVDLVPSSPLLDPMTAAVVLCASVVPWAYLASSARDPWYGEESLFAPHRRQSPLLDVVLVLHIQPVDVLSFRLQPRFVRVLSIFKVILAKADLRMVDLTR